MGWGGEESEGRGETTDRLTREIREGERERLTKQHPRDEDREVRNRGQRDRQREMDRGS